MSGLLALLDDVAGIAKVAAASVDDVAAQALKAGSKAAGAVIDDAAVTPKYLDGFAPARELPIVWRIAKGSIKNKLLFLLPAALLLSSFAPWLIAPLLMLGGAYLCFEGAEKIDHALFPGEDHAALHAVPAEEASDSTHLEEKKAAGAIMTDFILSAEIMTIALAAIPTGNIWMQGAVLALVGVGITVAVYGAVALIVKADDVGLYMAQNARAGAVKALGRGIVRFMPWFMEALTIVGTAAMLWVGGAIIIHGLAEMGWHWPEHIVHDFQHIAQHYVPEAISGFGGWLAKTVVEAILGLICGLFLLPIVARVIAPLLSRFTGSSAH